MNLSEYRKRAKELHVGLRSESEAARQRVLAAHSEYVGRPPERLDEQHLSLMDAQATVAVEAGFDSWADLVKSFDPEGTTRWSGINRIAKRAMDEAVRLGHGSAHTFHFLMAIVRGAESSHARQVLEQLGLTEAAVAERAGAYSDKKGGYTEAGPSFHKLTSWAEAFAAAVGEGRVSDEHALLAIVYSYTEHGLLESFNIDRDEVVEILSARGVAVPLARPPVPPTPVGPFGPIVYYPRSDSAAVLGAAKASLGHGPWGWNVSSWKPGFNYLTGSDQFDLESVVRSAATDPATIQVVEFREALMSEDRAHRAGA